MTEPEPPQLVAHFASRIEADLARSLLDENGIDARVTADDVQGLHPELGMLTGGAGLFVAAGNVQSARALLDDPGHGLTGADTEAETTADGAREPAPSRRRAAFVIAIAVVLLLIAVADAFRRGGMAFL